MFSIKSFCIDALIAVVVLYSSLTAFAQSDCVTLLIEKNGRASSDKIVQAYRRVLFESGASFVADDDLVEMLKRSGTSLDGLFFLDGRESSERSIVAKGLEQLLLYVEGNVAQKDTLVLALKTELEDELKLRRAENNIRDRTREKRTNLLPQSSTGAVFEPVEWPGLGMALKAPDGLIWIKLLEKESLANQGKVENGIIVDSDATRACVEVGGRLPTNDEFERLRKYFEQNSIGWMTDSGRMDFHRIFPGMKNKFFWSSSVHPGISDDYAFDFSGGNGNMSSGFRWHIRAVTCVSGP
jgi:hypothetical protein